MNLDGVVFFYKTIFPAVVDTIHKHFAPVDTVMKQVTAGSKGALDEGGPLISVLRKTYQSNWRNILRQSGLGTKTYAASLAQKV